MTRVQTAVSAFCAIALIVGCTVFVTLQLAGVSELVKTVSYLSEELHQRNYTNSTLPNSFETTATNTTLRGSIVKAFSTKRIVRESQCTAADSEIYARESQQCVVRDPFMHSCLETKFDATVVHQEVECLAQPGMIDPVTGQPNEAKFAKCVGDHVESVEGLSHSCAQCFGEHNFTMCTANKVKRAAEVCRTDMAACAEVLLTKCLPDIQKCTGMANVSMPELKKPTQYFSKSSVPETKRSKSEARKALMDKVKIPATTDSTWFPAMSEEKRNEWEKIFPRPSPSKKEEEHPIEELFA